MLIHWSIVYGSFQQNWVLREMYGPQSLKYLQKYFTEKVQKKFAIPCLKRPYIYLNDTTN